MIKLSASIRMPVLFISHGAPTMALEGGRTGAWLTRLGQALPLPTLILVISPHWMTRSIEIGAMHRQDTIHDFGGFPEQMYRLRYQAAGDPAFAQRLSVLLGDAGLAATLDEHRGLDHGAWVPLMHLYPGANVPVVQMSLPGNASPAELVALGEALAPLRDQGVLIMTSGSMTHNLADMRHAADGVLSYVQPFANWIAGALKDQDTDRLMHYRTLAPGAVRAHPDDDHLRPLFIAVGAAQNDVAHRTDTGITFNILSMDSYLFGDLPADMAPLSGDPVMVAA